MCCFYSRSKFLLYFFLFQGGSDFMQIPWSQVFPNIYLWTTFGVVSALEKIWGLQKPLVMKKEQISNYTIEIVSMLERTLAMAYTGDARVITQALMGKFGLKQSLLKLGLPSVIRLVDFKNDISHAFVNNPANWPLTATHEPAMASKRVQMLTYGYEHYLVSLCQLL
jgi:hypothetical protein